MKKYNLIKIMMELGYKERGAKSTITRNKNKYGISIEDYTNVSREQVESILDYLKKPNMISVFKRLEEFSSDESIDVIMEEDTPTTTVDMEVSCEDDTQNETSQVPKVETVSTEGETKDKRSAKSSKCISPLIEKSNKVRENNRGTFNFMMKNKGDSKRRKGRKIKS